MKRMMSVLVLVAAVITLASCGDSSGENVGKGFSKSDLIGRWCGSIAGNEVAYIIGEESLAIEYGGKEAVSGLWDLDADKSAIIFEYKVRFASDQIKMPFTLKGGVLKLTDYSTQTELSLRK